MDRYSLQLRILAICPYLAVVGDVRTALTVAVCFFIVLTAVVVAGSLSRNFVPAESRYLFHALVSGGTAWLVAALLLDHQVRADSPMLYLYVLLTAANGLVFTSSQDFAVRHDVRACLAHCASLGAKVAALLLLIGVLRELASAGRIFGLPLWQGEGLLLMSTPAGGLLLFALILAAFNLVQRVRPGS